MDNVLVRNLRKYRIKHNYSVKQIASLFDVEAMEVLAWEEGVKKPSNEILQKLAIIYKVPVEDFISGESVLFKVSMMSGVFNAIMNGLLVLTFFLPFATISNVYHNGFDVVLNGIVVSYNDNVTYLLVFYVIELIASIFVLFNSERVRYMYRYMNFVILFGTMIFAITSVFNYSSVIDYTVTITISLVIIAVLNNLLDLLLHRNQIINEDRQILIRKVVVYVTVAIMVMITVSILYDIFSNWGSMYIDWLYILLVVMMILFDLVGVSLTERMFHNRKTISYYLGALPSGLALFILVGSLVYGDVSGIDWGMVLFIIVGLSMPLLLVNLDYLSDFIKGLREKGKDTFTSK
jgi:DNA-binding XRE family transcriptional regulator